MYLYILADEAEKSAAAREGRTLPSGNAGL